MSPLKVSAVTRADPAPMVKVKCLVTFFDVFEPGLSVIGKSLSIDPFQVLTPTCALASLGSKSSTSPEWVVKS